MALQLERVEHEAGAAAQRAFDQIALRFPGVRVHTTTATTASPTTTSTASPMTAVIPEMTITADFAGHSVIAAFSGTFAHSAATGQPTIAIFDDGTARGQSQRIGQADTAGGRMTLATIEAWTPAAGGRTIEVRWATVAAGTATAEFDLRQLVILEIG